MAKRKGQWFGNSVLQSTGTSAASQVIQLLPVRASLGVARDLVFERSIVSFQTRRFTAATIEGLAYVVWHGGVNPTTGLPLQVFNPVQVAGLEEWANKNIMRFGPLAVAGCHSNPSDDVLLPIDSLFAHQEDFDVKRSVAAGNESIFLQVAADVSGACKTYITWRTYYTYS